jgi:hypothetical protein
MDKQRNPSLLRQALSSTFVNHWPEARKVSASQVVAALLGLALPVAVGAATGYGQSGVAAALGGLAIGLQKESGAFRDRISALVYALVAGSTATFIGATLSGKGLITSIVVVAVAAAAALFGSISRPLARATTQFMIFLIIAANMNLRAAHPAGITMLFALGALWTAVLALWLGPLFQAIRSSSARNHQTADAPLPRYSAKLLLGRWRKSLLRQEGWQYTLRIALCLSVAEIIRWVWPHDHSYWISLTVAIVVHRNLQAALTRTLQRALGTVLGVLLVSILLLGLPPLWIIIVLIALLAAARPILIDINYVAYVAVVTPLIILLLDFGRDPSVAVIANRLIATFVGCFIALILGYVTWARFAGSSPAAMTGRK